MLMKAAFEHLEEVQPTVTAEIGQIDAELNGDDCDHFLHCYNEEIDQIKEAQQVAITLEAMCASVANATELNASSAAALNVAVESLCQSIGYSAGDTRIPKFDPKNLKASLESFSGTIKAIVDRILEFLKKIWDSVKSFFTGAEAASALVEKRADALKKQIEQTSPEMVSHVDHLIKEDQEKHGVPSEEVLLQMENISLARTRPTEPRSGFPAIFDHNLGNFFISYHQGNENYYQTRHKDILVAIPKTMEILDGISRVMAQYAVDVKQHFSTHSGPDSLPDLKDLFIKHLKSNMVEGKDDSTAGGHRHYEGEKNSKDDGNFYFTVHFTLGESITVESRKSHGGMVAMSSQYSWNSSIPTTGVGLCPPSLAKQLLSQISKHSRVFAEECHEFEGVMNVAIGELKWYTNQTAGLLDDERKLTPEGQERMTKIKNASNTLFSLKTFFGLAVSYQLRCNQQLLRWITETEKIRKDYATRGTEV